MDMLQLKRGRTRVRVAPEAGGRIVQIEVALADGWTPLLVSPDDPRRMVDEPLAWGCYPMAPWPGRIDGSRFVWRDHEYELPRNDGAHSIHGRAMYLPWQVDGAETAACAMRIAIGPAQGWPWDCEIVQAIMVEDTAVALRLEVRSAGSIFPAGAGWHPWFRRDVRPGAMPSMRVPARGHYVRRADLIPTGEIVVPAGDADLRDGPALGSRKLDDFYCGVEEPMSVRWGDLELTMTSSANCAHAVVFTEQARGFCVEPQTCAPDAFNLEARGVAAGVSVVEPGRPLVVTSRWSWDSAPGPTRR